MEEDEKKEIPVELKSEEVQEIMGQFPPYIQRWGITVIGIVVAILFIGSYFISYPDMITTAIILSPEEKEMGKSNIKGYVELSTTEMKSIKEGAEVQLRMLLYPETEYGYITGKVARLPLTPTTPSRYQVGIIFPQGFVTDRGKKLHVIAGMEGQATIITQKRRLLERLVNMSVFKLPSQEKSGK